MAKRRIDLQDQNNGFDYFFSRDEGDVGSINTGLVVPGNSAFIGGFLIVTGAFASGGAATISITTANGRTLMAPLAVGGFTFTAVFPIDLRQRFATPITDEVQITIGAFALTQGRCIARLDFVQVQPPDLTT